MLEKFARFPKHVRDYQTIISEGLHETNAVDKGIMRRNTCVPNLDKYEMIYSGPHFYVGNPLYKSPRSTCLLNSDYDNIDLMSISEDYVARTNYTPTIGLDKYKALIQGFQIGKNELGQPVYGQWIDYYRLAFRLMTGGGAGERTLTTAILPPHCSHIVTVISTVFKDIKDTVELAGLGASIALDYFIKTIGCGAIHATRIESFPMGIEDRFKAPLYLRTLLLNCLTRPYAELWEEMWRDEYREQTWSVVDERLKPFAGLTRQWTWDVPLRNYFERRQALVEIDVLSAMALGLSLHDLETMYNIQFPVLKANEQDTWYDRRGRIVFTCSKGLTGVGLDRPTWEAIRGEAVRSEAADGEAVCSEAVSGEAACSEAVCGQSATVLTYAGASPTYTHTIDPGKSELYGDRRVTYYAPYTCCDRVADYRRAWQHFSALYACTSE